MRSLVYLKDISESQDIEYRAAASPDASVCFARRIL